MSKNNTVMFAASQGGHFKELMGLQSLFDRYQGVLVTDNLSANKDQEQLKNFNAIEYPAAIALRRKKSAGTTKANRLNSLYSYLKLLFQCIIIYNKYKPAVIVSTGSYIAVPLLIYGKLHGSKTIFIESNAKVYSKTMTGKIVERFSDKIYVQWPEMLDVYSKAEYFGTIH